MQLLFTALASSFYHMIHLTIFAMSDEFWFGVLSGGIQSDLKLNKICKKKSFAKNINVSLGLDWFNNIDSNFHVLCGYDGYFKEEVLKRL